jgi:two-component system, NarL family, response regulator NreC
VSPPAQIQHDGKIRCMLVHDHVLFRQGVRRLLEDEPDIEVQAEAGNAAEALRMVLEHRPQIVIADPRLFGRDTETCVQAIVRESPTSKVLFMTADHGDGIAAGGRRGIHAVRHTSASELIATVRNTCTPEPSVTKEKHRREIAHWPLEELSPRQRTLTVRERQVLKLLAEGRTVRSVATILGLSIKTVDAHKFNLMRKLGIHNKAELVMWAIQKKVLKLPVNL